MIPGMNIADRKKAGITPQYGKSRLLEYNAVIEATEKDREDIGWLGLSFYRERLIIPGGIGRLRWYGHEHAYDLDLYGKTDFFSVKRYSGGSGVITIDKTVGDHPRVACLKDGRVYLDKALWTDEAYLQMLPNIVGMAGEMFRTGRFSH